MWQYHIPKYFNFTDGEEFIVILYICILLVDLLQTQWTPGRTQKPTPRVFTMKEDSKAFADHFDQVRDSGIYG